MRENEELSVVGPSGAGNDVPGSDAIDTSYTYLDARGEASFRSMEPSAESSSPSSRSRRMPVRHVGVSSQDSRSSVNRGGLRRDRPLRGHVVDGRMIDPTSRSLLELVHNDVFESLASRFRARGQPRGAPAASFSASRSSRQ